MKYLCFLFTRVNKIAMTMLACTFYCILWYCLSACGKDVTPPTPPVVETKVPPGAPINLEATPGASSVKFSWGAPSFTGSINNVPVPLTGYKVTTTNGDTITVAATVTSVTLTATNGKKVSGTVSAITEKAGSSAPAASNEVIPRNKRMEDLVSGGKYWQWTNSRFKVKESDPWIDNPLGPVAKANKHYFNYDLSWTFDPGPSTWGGTYATSDTDLSYLKMNNEVMTILELSETATKKTLRLRRIGTDGSIGEDTFELIK